MYGRKCLALLQTLKAWTDAGDIVGAKGSVKKTDKGEVSVYVKSWAMLSKSVLPLPDKFHGLKDTEKRYRQVLNRRGAVAMPPFILQRHVIP